MALFPILESQGAAGVPADAAARDRRWVGQFPHVRLMHDLLNPADYDRRVRPVRNNSRPVMVQIRWNLYQIVDVVCAFRE